MIYWWITALILKAYAMEILEMSKITSSETAEEVFERVYQPAFLSVARYISRNGGSFEEARDIFHDALVIFYEQGRSPSSIQSEVHYITGIAKHLWSRTFRDDIKKVTLGERATESSSTESPSVDEVKLLQLLEWAGKRCMDLLVSFYIEKMGLVNIRRSYDFSSDHSASVQKYKCIEKVRDVIKNKSMSYEDFFE